MADAGGQWVAVVSLMVAGAVAWTGCSAEKSPREPGGAYRLYREALFDGDVDSMWERSAPSTKQYFEERYQQLVDMDDQIEEYLPATDHEIARQQTGAELLEDLDGPKGLFQKVVAPENLSTSWARKIGSEVDRIRVGKKEKKAEVVTRSGRKYRLTKGDEGEWYVALVKSVDAIDKQFEWLDRNREALTETVNKRLEAKQEEREKIIADLMDVEE